MMAEIIEVQLKPSIIHQPDDVAHRRHSRGCAIGRQAHYLVLVAIVREAEVLGQRLVEDAERMREVHPPFHSYVGPAADPPSGAAEVAEAVDRNDDRLVEW